MPDALKTTADATKTHFNGLHITSYGQGKSKWLQVTGSGSFCGICQPWDHTLTCTGHISTGDSHWLLWVSLWVGWGWSHRCSSAFKKKTGQALLLLSEQGSAISWIFYGPEGIWHPLRGVFGPPQSSHLVPTSSSSQLNPWSNSLGMEDDQETAPSPSTKLC